jgi:uncharacterized protein
MQMYIHIMCTLMDLIKHGLSLEEIESFFLAGALVFDDAKHSHVEARYIAVGNSPKNRKLMFVSFTVRVMDFKLLIRPISARYMRPKEAKAYEAYKKEQLQKK